MTDHDPTWREVRDAAETQLLSELAVVLNRLYTIGVKGLVVCGRIAQPSEGRALQAEVFAGGASDLGEEDFVTLLAMAVAMNPKVEAAIPAIKDAPAIRRDLGRVSATDLLSVRAQSEAVARCLREAVVGGGGQ